MYFSSNEFGSLSKFRKPWLESRQTRRHRAKHKPFVKYRSNINEFYEREEKRKAVPAIKFTMKKKKMKIFSRSTTIHRYWIISRYSDVDDWLKVYNNSICQLMYGKFLSSALCISLLFLIWSNNRNYYLKMIIIWWPVSINNKRKRTTKYSPISRR